MKAPDHLWILDHDDRWFRQEPPKEWGGTRVLYVRAEQTATQTGTPDENIWPENRPPHSEYPPDIER